MGKLIVAAARFLLLCAVLLLFLTIMLPDRAFAQQPTLANNPTQGPPGTLIPVLGHAHQAITFLTQMITLAMQNGGEGQEAQLEALKQQIEALPKPKRGDRKAARLQHDKGLEEFKKERYEQALQFFLTAYQLDPGDVEVVNNVGMTYLKTGNLPEAARYLGGALSLAPIRAAAWGNLAEVFAHDSRPEEAVAAYALTYRYSKNKDATQRLLEAQTTNVYDPQAMQAAKAALALPLISGGLKEQPTPTPTPPPQEAERPRQEAASQQVIQSAASRCTGDQIEKMINAGFSKEEIARLCETTTESPAKGTLSREEVVAPVPVAQSQIMTLDELNAFATKQAKAYKVTINSMDPNQGLEYKKLLRSTGDYLSKVVLVRGKVEEFTIGTKYAFASSEGYVLDLHGLTPQSPVHKLRADDFLIIGIVVPGLQNIGSRGGINIHLICGILSDAPSKRAEVRCDSVKKP